MFLKVDENALNTIVPHSWMRLVESSNTEISGDSVYFVLCLLWSFLAQPFSGTALVANGASEKSERLRPFCCLRNKVAKLLNAHFLIQIYFFALCGDSLIIFLGLRLFRSNLGDLLASISNTQP